MALLIGFSGQARPIPVPENTKWLKCLNDHHPLFSLPPIGGAVEVVKHKSMLFSGKGQRWRQIRLRDTTGKYEIRFQRTPFWSLRIAIGLFILINLHVTRRYFSEACSCAPRFQPRAAVYPTSDRDREGGGGACLWWRMAGWLAGWRAGAG